MNIFAFAAVGWLYPGVLMQPLSDANHTFSLERAGVPGAKSYIGEKSARARLGTTRYDILFPFDRPQSAKRMIRFRRIGSGERERRTEFSTLPIAPYRRQKIADHFRYPLLLSSNPKAGLGTIQTTLMQSHNRP